MAVEAIGAAEAGNSAPGPTNTRFPVVQATILLVLEDHMRKRGRSGTARRARRVKGAAAAVSLGVASGVSAPPAGAEFWPYSLPLRETVMTQGNLGQGACHGGESACASMSGSNASNYWSVDLYDSGVADSPVFSTFGGVVKAVQLTGTPAGSRVSVRHGNVFAGSGFGNDYGHGKSGSVPSSIFVGQVTTPGVMLMKMGQTGTLNGIHLHFEIRYMANVGTWASNFNGYCAKHYLNKARNNLNPEPLTLAWSTAYGGHNTCLAPTS